MGEEILEGGRIVPGGPSPALCFFFLTKRGGVWVGGGDEMYLIGLTGPIKMGDFLYFSIRRALTTVYLN